MAILLDRTTFEETTGHTPDADPAKYLILTRLTTALNDSVRLLIQGNVPRRFWKVVGTPPDETVAEMTNPEKLVVETARLNTMKGNLLRQLVGQLNEFIEAKYSTDHKLTIMAYLDEARALGHTNRATYFAQVFSYVKSVLDYYYTVKTDVIAAANFNQLNQVAQGIDIDQFHATDPGVVIEVGRAIAD